MAATMIASIDASAMARLGSPLAPRQRQDRGGDHRSERGVRAQHQDP